jgi:hypothetical protein
MDIQAALARIRQAVVNSGESMPFRSSEVRQHPTFWRGSARDLLLVKAPKDEPRADLIFHDGPPPELRDAKLTINATAARPVAVEGNKLVVAPMGPPHDLLKPGLNYFYVNDKMMMFWYDGTALRSFVSPFRNSFALIVAIDDYERKKDTRKRGKTGYPELGAMVAQAEMLRETLKQVGFGTITPLYDADATTDKIDDALESLVSKDTRQWDRVFLYFGGHGEGETKYESSYVTYDFDPKKPLRTRLYTANLIGNVARRLNAKHVFVAFDFCFSGLTVPLDLSGGGDRAPKLDPSLGAVLSDFAKQAHDLMAAGYGNQTAIYKNGGIFTRGLYLGLQGAADYNSDGVLQVEELALFVRRYVQSEIQNSDTFLIKDQTPVYWHFGGEGKSLFLIPPIAHSSGPSEKERIDRPKGDLK